MSDEQKHNNLGVNVSSSQLRLQPNGLLNHYSNISQKYFSYYDRCVHSGQQATVETEHLIAIFFKKQFCRIFFLRAVTKTSGWELGRMCSALESDKHRHNAESRTEPKRLATGLE